MSYKQFDRSENNTDGQFRESCPAGLADFVDKLYRVPETFVRCDDNSTGRQQTLSSSEFEKLGIYGQTGPQTLGCESVDVATDGNRIRYSLNRPDVQVGNQLQPPPPFDVFGTGMAIGRSFRFDIDGDDRLLELTNIQGLTFRVGDRDLPVRSVAIGVEETMQFGLPVRTTVLTLTTQDGNQLTNHTVPIPLEDIHHTHAGFMDLLRYGRSLRRERRMGQPEPA